MSSNDQIVRHLRRVVNGEPVHRDELYVSNRMKVWLDSGARTTVEAAKRVGQTLVNDATGRASGEGRVRSSMVGKCVRAQAFSYHGIPHGRVFNVATQAIFYSGHFHHYMWQLAGLSAGWLTDIEVPVAITEGPMAGFAGYADGVCDDGSVLEVKSCNWSVYQQRQVRYDDLHVDQVHGYMHALGTDKASIVYVHRDNPGDFIEYRITKDPAVMERLIADCEAVVASTKDNMPPPLPECVIHEGAYKYCDFSSICKPEGDHCGNPVKF